MADRARVRALDAVDILNDFIGDLTMGSNMLREFAIKYQRGRLSIEEMVSIKQMCLSYLVLTLCKFIEFWKRYRDVVPTEYRASCKSVLGCLTDRKVSDFRNKCVGHIWDRDHKRPLVHSEIMSRLEVVMNNDLSSFLNWLNNPKDNTYPSTVVSVVETMRDALMTKHSIRSDEFVNR